MRNHRAREPSLISGVAALRVERFGAPVLTLELMAITMSVHGKGGRSKKMKSSDSSNKREVAEA